MGWRLPISLRRLLPVLALAIPCAAHAQEAGGSGGGKEESGEGSDQAGRPEIRQHRWDEDWRSLCDPVLRTEPLDRLKCVTLAPGATLTMSGELRERFETVDNPGFGIAQSSDRVLLHRAWLGADLRFGDGARAFVEVGYLDQSGREGEPEPTDVDRLDLLQAFVDLSAPVAQGQATLRAGRMEMTFGSQRLVALREGPNAHRTFDGARASWEGSDQHRLDAFLARPTETKRGTFDDNADENERFWSVYGTGPAVGPLKADLYYLGYRRETASFAAGDERELRHSVGARLFGEGGGWDWDVEAVHQFGRFGSGRIRAWTLATDTGFTLDAAPLKPRLGLKADVASGDGDLDDGTLGTFNALYPKQPYFSEADLATPANIVDIHPSLEFELGSGLTLGIGSVFQWRYSRADAIYLGDLTEVEGSAGGSQRYIGTQLVADIEWQVSPRLTLRTHYVHFERGGAVREAGGQDVDFLLASAAFRF